MNNNNMFEKSNGSRKGILVLVDDVPTGTIIETTGLEFTESHAVWRNKEIVVFPAKAKIVPNANNYYEFVSKGPSLFFHKDWLYFKTDDVTIPPLEAKDELKIVEHSNMVQYSNDTNPAPSNGTTDEKIIDFLKITYERDVGEVRELLQKHLRDNTELIIKVNNLLAYSVILNQKIQDYKKYAGINKETIT